MSNEEQKKRSGDESPMAAYAIYGAAGVQLAAVVVAGLLLGGYLDGKLGWSPLLTIVGITLGFIGGLVNLVRILGWFSRSRRP